MGIELAVDDKKKLQNFMSAGYQIEFFEEKINTIEGEFDPLVWHHYEAHIIKETNEKFYYITNRWDDEGELVVNKTFKTKEQVVEYILENNHKFERGEN